MAVSLVVQNQNHVVLRRLTAEIKDLGSFAMKLPSDEGLLMRGIHPYGDTYFNMIQLKFLIDEIDRLAARDPEQAAMLHVIAALPRRR